MIESNQYVKKVQRYFSYLLTEFGYEITSRIIRGNVFYDVRFTKDDIMVSISFENLEDYLVAVIYLLENGGLPSFDDDTRTLHVETCAATEMHKLGKVEIENNNKQFSAFIPSDDFDKRLLNVAKGLRLCLKHSDQLHRIQH